jgi:hypothetical protein
MCKRCVLWSRGEEEGEEKEEEKEKEEEEEEEEEVEEEEEEEEEEPADEKKMEPDEDPGERSTEAGADAGDDAGEKAGEAKMAASDAMGTGDWTKVSVLAGGHVSVGGHDMLGSSARGRRSSCTPRPWRSCPAPSRSRRGRSAS